MRFLNNVEDNEFAAEQQRSYYCEAEDEFETNLRDFEEMIENEGWMYLYELGFATWDDYERSCVSDEDEERAEVALREEEADFEAAEREDFVYWITDEDEELIDIFNALEVEKAQDHLQDDRWSYQPGDSDAEEYFELLYRYNRLLGLE